MLKFPPCLLAAASVFSAMCTMSGCKHWKKTCAWHTGYSQDRLMDCSRLMITFHLNAASAKLTGVLSIGSTTLLDMATQQNANQLSFS
ncbi:hypothetical protein SOVF_151010 [Spinacia oleracea]|uniref:G2/mitotic-specific cyclin-2-like n=1 Tax=Spinacia oleracea TaxID=3562 RepID=A0ABM3REJ3_SPIOL|nr:G2/mitotic-specific cyclin-2-like [Spinacia oleracea]KNA09722.1 hypothetical protein SOVF_151010 [Spinacia oleracea]